MGADPYLDGSSPVHDTVPVSATMNLSPAQGTGEFLVTPSHMPLPFTKWASLLRLLRLTVHPSLLLVSRLLAPSELVATVPGAK